DYETLSLLLIKYPLQVCAQPIAIEVTTISGTPCVTRTPWFDRDNPSGLGDYETLSLLLIKYPLQVCAQPIAIEVTTISGTPALPPGNNFQVYGHNHCLYDPLQGFECVNGACQDYRVRFTCPLSFCNMTCVTRWFDSDNPNTNGGDSELLTVLLSVYPGYICPNPLGIEAQTISGQPAYQTGNIFQVYNPTSGFSCVNANQGRVRCVNYKVRFTCPEDWCSSECMCDNLKTYFI
uniref:Si:dkey-205h13.2 n=1 Tax=Cyprinus carpio TaxID=7962 RepID=A0A8C2IMB6_CYPCA